MRIGCIGASNHLMFVLGRFLNERGHDATTVVLAEDPHHFHPSFDTFDVPPDSAVREVDWGNLRTFLTTSASSIRRDLSDFDRLVACGLGPAFCGRAGRRVDLFAPYGDDLRRYPFSVGDGWLRRIPGAIAARHQAKAIRSARRIFVTDFYLPYREALARLGVLYDRVPMPPVYFPELDGVSDEEAVSRSNAAATVWRLAQSHPVVYSHSRQWWSSAPPSMGRGKGNDTLLRAFARLLGDLPGARLVLLEYGIDVAESKALAASLGITDALVWLPQQPRRELLLAARFASVGIDQFPGPHTGGGYGYSTVELMSAGKPMIGQLFDPAGFERDHGFAPPPIVHVEDEVQAARALIDLLTDGEARARLGVQGRDWARLHYGSEAVRRIATALEAETPRSGTRLSRPTGRSASAR